MKMTLKIQNLKFTLVMVLLCSTVVLANIGKTEKIMPGKKIGLKDVPRQVGEWRMISDKSGRGLVRKWEFFNEVLLRTYAREDGRIVWLAIAYGSDQRQAFSFHLPERCYRAAGCDVESVGEVSVFGNGVKLKRLISRGGGRVEPISYWVILDGKVVTSHLERKIRQFLYTVLEKPAYGTLVRISSGASEGEVDSAYSVQADFIKQLGQSLSPDLRVPLFGDMLDGRVP